PSNGDFPDAVKAPAKSLKTRRKIASLTVPVELAPSASFHRAVNVSSPCWKKLVKVSRAKIAAPIATVRMVTRNKRALKFPPISAKASSNPKLKTKPRLPETGRIATSATAAIHFVHDDIHRPSTKEKIR